MDFGFWILDFGFWILDFGFWILDFGSWILDLGFWILDFGFWSLEFGVWILDQFSIRSFCGGPKRRRLDLGFWILDFGFWSLDFGFWILDFGVWILDFGFWILVWMRPYSTSFGSCIRYFHVTPTRVGGLITSYYFYNSLYLLYRGFSWIVSVFGASVPMSNHDISLRSDSEEDDPETVKRLCVAVRGLAKGH